MPRKLSNIDDVARLAEVSIATVSRALRGHSNVSASTRARVERAAEVLNYKVDPSASRLASGRSSSVALAVPVLDSWYFSTVMAGVESTFAANDYELTMYVTGNAEARRRLVASPLPRGTEGLILVDVGLTSAEVATLVANGGPAVSIGHAFDRMASVVVDDVAIGRQATEHLLALGHTEIALLSGTAEDRLAFEVPDRRRRGYLSALAAAGVPFRPEFEVKGDFSVLSGYRAMLVLLALESPPTAVFSMSDEMAFGALKAIRDAGLRVPTDLSIVGVDDHPMSWVENLTTVHQPVIDHGTAAAEEILAQIADPDRPLSRVEPETTFIVRESTGPVPNQT